MKNSVRAKSSVLLLVFTCYLVLSCAPEADEKSQAIETTISKIQERLSKKDYRSNSRSINPKQNLKNKRIKSKRFMKKEFRTKIHSINKFKQVNTNNSDRSTFRLASVIVPVRLDESLTFGFDNPSNLEAVVGALTSFYQGAVDGDRLRTLITDVNTDMLNYPFTFSGADQFLNDAIIAGTITETQRSILHLELEAIAYSSSTVEISNILNVVNEELAGSQFSSSEFELLYNINAGVEGAIEEQAIAYNERGNFRPVGEWMGSTWGFAGLIVTAVFWGLRGQEYCNEWEQYYQSTPTILDDNNGDDCWFYAMADGIGGIALYEVIE